jgi:hypothetical protein
MASNELQAYQEALDKATKLSVLKEQPEFDIIESTMLGLIGNLTNLLMNDEPVDFETYKELRYKIEGIRMVVDAFDAIERNGVQAADSIALINGQQ